MPRVAGLLGVMAMGLAASTAMAGEHRLTGIEITLALADHSFAGENGGHRTEQIFQKAGPTYYSTDGNQSQGFWKVEGDQYCSQWPPHEAWSCYGVTVDGDITTFISSAGTRYPMKREN